MHQEDCRTVTDLHNQHEQSSIITHVTSCFFIFTLFTFRKLWKVKSEYTAYVMEQIVAEFLLSEAESQLTCSKQWDQLFSVLACWPACSSGCCISIRQSDLWTCLPLEVNGSPSPPSVFSLRRSNYSKHGRTQRKQWKRGTPASWLWFAAERLSLWNSQISWRRRHQMNNGRVARKLDENEMIYCKMQGYVVDILHSSGHEIQELFNNLVSVHFAKCKNHQEFLRLMPCCIN